ncbi:DeoR/GlpR family DNA-binding transcription regulator [Paenibacillus koleovorans]|uniref:DeoR/GlpR family DNA-binding transcription regulator n=1 Tax=Paenibacillus koleovorans TaxID=121608 RepID=UPI0013E2A3D0|nr:DeoR/GlpR family DNA-binding transcription regulator [Paenibacillus koleovorans]
MQNDRQEQLIQLLEQHVMLRIQQLCDKLHASPATIRRDLAHLEEQGYVLRVNGGAMMNARATVGTAERSLEAIGPLDTCKKAIARVAITLVHEGDTIFIDSGSTNNEIAELLTGLSNISIVTNSVEIAYKFKLLARSRNISVFVCGGTIKEFTPEASIVGPLAEQMISQFRANVAFIGTAAIDLQHGVTEPYLLVANIKKTMIEYSSKVVLTADHSKFGKVNMAHVCHLNNLHHVITDQLTPDSYVDSLSAVGVQVTRAMLS